MGCNDGTVGTDPSEEEEPPVSSEVEVEVWLAGAMPSITELLAAAKRIMGVVALGPETTQATTDQLEVAALHAREWHSDHPCPDPVIDERLAAAFHTVTALADDCAAAANSAALDAHALDERAGQAVADLSTALYATKPAEQ